MRLPLIAPADPSRPVVDHFGQHAANELTRFPGLVSTIRNGLTVPVPERE